jgi:hypothetical protein
MAEVVGGSWSVDISYRVLSMFTAWFSGEGNTTCADYRAVNARIRDLRANGTPKDQIEMAASASAVWTWVRLMIIQAGPDIDTNKVYRITELIGKDAIQGGSPSAFYNMAPIDLDSIKANRGIA